MESDTEKVDISDPSSLFHLIKPQWPTTNERPKHKFWHFKFAADETESQFTAALEKLGDNVTVKYNYVGKDKPDVLLTDNGEFIGKIQFIHFDKRDRKTQAKHYIKLYFIQFEPTMFEKAKKIVVQFFDERRDASLKEKEINGTEHTLKDDEDLLEEPKENFRPKKRVLSQSRRKTNKQSNKKHDNKNHDNKNHDKKNNDKKNNDNKIKELKNKLVELNTRRNEIIKNQKNNNNSIKLTNAYTLQNAA